MVRESRGHTLFLAELDLPPLAVRRIRHDRQNSAVHDQPSPHKFRRTHMSPWYLLTCECGESLNVMPRHAGENRECVCGQTIQVPKLREIRELPRAPDDPQEASKQARPKSTWTPLKATLFVIGIPICLIAAAFAAYSYWYASKIGAKYTSKPTIARMQEVAPHEYYRIDIDESSLFESVEDIWKPLTAEANLPAYVEPPYIFYRNMRADYVQRGEWGWMAAALGGGLSIIGLILPGKKRH